MQDDYQNWAQHYDLFGDAADFPADEAAFLHTVFQKNEVHRVLDCACGTGPHLLHLAGEGYDICGSDFSDAMLDVCRKNLNAAGVNLPLKQADFRYLDRAWQGDFDAVLCMTQSIAHMQTDDDLLTAFRSMYSMLRPGGILILTQGTTHFTLQDRFRFDLAVNNPRFTRVFSRDIGEQYQTIHILDIWHTETENRMEHTPMTLRIVLDDDFRDFLTRAGFSKIDIYGGFDFSPYDRESSRKLIVAAQR